MSTALRTPELADVALAGVLEDGAMSSGLTKAGEWCTDHSHSFCAAVTYRLGTL